MNPYNINVIYCHRNLTIVYYKLLSILSTVYIILRHLILNYYTIIIYYRDIYI